MHRPFGVHLQLQEGTPPYLANINSQQNGHQVENSTIFKT